MSEFSELLDEYYELRNIIEQIYEAVEAGRDIKFGDVVYTSKKPRIKLDIVDYKALSEIVANNDSMREHTQKLAEEICDKACNSSEHSRCIASVSIGGIEYTPTVDDVSRV